MKLPIDTHVFTVALSAAFLALAACSVGPIPIGTSPHDPSNPAATEGAAPLVAIARPVPTPSSAPAAAPHHDHAAAAYVCPMHPEVTSDAPGLCPKCNMKLEPKK